MTFNFLLHACSFMVNDTRRFWIPYFLYLHDDESMNDGCYMRFLVNRLLYPILVQKDYKRFKTR